VCPNILGLKPRFFMFFLFKLSTSLSPTISVDDLNSCFSKNARIQKEISIDSHHHKTTPMAIFEHKYCSFLPSSLEQQALFLPTENSFIANH
jgi:hypothetical protein